MKSRRRWPMVVGVILLVVLAVDGFLIVRRQRYEAESVRLRKNMTEMERLTADAIMAKEKERSDVMFELLRRQATGDPSLHLSVMLDSSVMILERQGAVLRTMPVAIGAEGAVDTVAGGRRVARPSGVRSIDRIIGPDDRYILPSWVWQQRNLPVPDDRSNPAFLGEGALVLSGGTLVYALPKEGPLADSTWVMPGTIRLQKADLEAIRPNLTPGMKIYLY